MILNFKLVKIDYKYCDYLRKFDNFDELKLAIDNYIEFYNNKVVNFSLNIYDKFTIKREARND